MPKNRYTEQEKNIIRRLYSAGITPSGISAALRKEGYHRTPHNINDWIYYNKRKPFEPVRSLTNNPDQPWLVCGDFHAPYHHSNALNFLQAVARKYNTREHIYCTGDLFDFHSMSRHTTEMDSPNPEDEYYKALEFASELASAFPYGTLVLGNHDRIPQRQMKEARLSDVILKDHNDLYGLPSTWTIEPLYAIIEETDTLIEHGIGSNGVNGAINTAIAKESNYAQGHTHSYAGAFIRSNHRGLRWALNTGCLIDNTSLAMRYGRYMKHKGVLGCGLIWPACNGIAEHPQFVPMGF